MLTSLDGVEGVGAGAVLRWVTECGGYDSWLLGWIALFDSALDQLEKLGTAGRVDLTVARDKALSMRMLPRDGGGRIAVAEETAVFLPATAQPPTRTWAFDARLVTVGAAWLATSNNKSLETFLTKRMGLLERTPRSERAAFA